MRDWSNLFYYVVWIQYFRQIQLVCSRGQFHLNPDVGLQFDDTKDSSSLEKDARSAFDMAPWLEAFKPLHQLLQDTMYFLWSIEHSSWLHTPDFLVILRRFGSIYIHDDLLLQRYLGPRHIVLHSLSACHFESIILRSCSHVTVLSPRCVVLFNLGLQSQY